MKSHTSVVIFIGLITAACCQAAFYNLQDDGSILCEKREDCPDDVPDKANNTVLEFRCAPRSSFDDERETESPDNEKIIITEEWYLNQLICGEEIVDICCTQFADPGQCVGFDKEICDEDDAEVYGGTKPPIQIVSATKTVGVTVPLELRGAKCGPQQCTRRKRVPRRGVITVCCNIVIVRGIYACPPRRKGNCKEM